MTVKRFGVKKLSKLIFPLLGSLVFILIFYKLIHVWEEIKYNTYISSFPSLLLSIVFISMFFILLAVGWSFVFSKLSRQLNFKELVFLYSKSQLARYLPGGIWNYVGRAAILKAKNVNYSIILQSFILEAVLLALSSLITGIMSCFRILNNIEVLIGFFIIILLTIGLYTYRPIINYFYKLLIKKDIYLIRIPNLFLFKMLLFYITAWIVASVGFALFVFSISDLDQNLSFLNVCGLFPLSWIVGFISPMPGGIGVRETALIMLANRLDIGSFSYLISVASRGLIIVAEIISFGLILAWNHFNNDN